MHDAKYYQGKWTLSEHEKPSWEYMQSLLFDNCVFFDIGCQKGIYSQGVSETFKLSTIHAFDVVRHPEMLKITQLKRNVHFHNIALGDGLPRDCCIAYNAKVSIRCNTIRLDEFVLGLDLKKIDFMKIDVDDVELFVLEGARQILREYKPALMVEIDNDNVAPCEALLNAFGYRHIATRNDINRFYV